MCRQVETTQSNALLSFTNVTIATLLSSKHFKILAVNFNRVCSVFASDHRVTDQCGFFFLGLNLEYVFQEQSHSSLHSGRSLAWDHVCGDIDDPCCIIANPCDVVAIPEVIGGCAFADRCATR